jgi:hypothetical protein
MDQDQKGNTMIAIGLILIILDWTILYGFFISTTFLGLCFLCSGISQKNRAKAYKQKTWNHSQQTGTKAYPQNQYTKNPNMRSSNMSKQNVIETSYEEEVSAKSSRETHKFCPICGAKAPGNFCPVCGSKID